MSNPRVDEDKQQRLAEFHERNQQFLSQSRNKNNSQRESKNDFLHLNKQILELQLQVRQLTHELETAQEAHQLLSEKSRAEVALLHTQIQNEKSRHEKITASLRNKLVESELERVKMQDQLRVSAETKIKDDNDVKLRCMEMASRIDDEKKWVDEQMDHWRESMEGRQTRFHDAKIRGTIDAGLVDNDRTEKEVNVKDLDTTSASGRRSRQRQLWGQEVDYTDSKEEDDDDDDDTECERIFGKEV